MTGLEAPLLAAGAVVAAVVLSRVQLRALSRGNAHANQGVRAHRDESDGGAEERDLHRGLVGTECRRKGRDGIPESASTTDLRAGDTRPDGAL